MGPLVSLLFSDRVRPVLRVVTMTVFVNEMLLMIAGDVERNPGPGKGWCTGSTARRQWRRLWVH